MIRAAVVVLMIRRIKKTCLLFFERAVEETSDLVFSQASKLLARERVIAIIQSHDEIHIYDAFDRMMIRTILTADLFPLDQC